MDRWERFPRLITLEDGFVPRIGVVVSRPVTGTRICRILFRVGAEPRCDQARSTDTPSSRDSIPPIVSAFRAVTPAYPNYDRAGSHRRIAPIWLASRGRPGGRHRVRAR